MARRGKQQGGLGRRGVVLGGVVAAALVLAAVLVLVARTAQAPRPTPVASVPYPQVTPLPDAVPVTVFFDFQ